jgi:hypothetical protein
MFELRRISYNTWDLFQGKGWDTVSRIRRGKSGTFVMAGMRLSRPLLKELDATLYNNFPCTPGMSLEQTVNHLSHISWRH